jgi:nicotinamide-nucleotide amidase
MSTAAILSTGTEILQGHYADTNAQWLSAKLTTLGITVQRHVAAPDRPDDIADALAYLVERHDLVIMTGGLGPTEDDLTRQAVCKVFGTELAEDDRAWKMIVDRFALRGSPPPESNRVQCLIPKSARTLYNLWGTAPGFVIETPGFLGAMEPCSSRRGAKEGASMACALQDEKHGISRGTSRCRLFAALPGPPRENRPMFEKYLEKLLARRFGGGLLARITTLHTFGISESALNDCLRPLFEEIGDAPDRVLAFLAGEARVDVRLTVRAATRRALAAAERPLLTRIRRLLPRDCIYGRNDDTLESVASALLRRRGLKLAVAESCTGGLIAKRLTDLAGSSDVLLEGWVTYSNTAKRRRLGVRAATLRRHGAVSSETAREMAVGALRKSGADVAVAVTGIAGPSGGTPEKPVGLVWYGLAWRSPLHSPSAKEGKAGVGSREKSRMGSSVGSHEAGQEGSQAGCQAGSQALQAASCAGSRAGSQAEHPRRALRVETFRTCFPSGREMVRLFASHRALDLVRRLLLDLPLEVPPISRPTSVSHRGDNRCGGA